jgi:DNA-binding XRE family transcriptional regulator
MSRRAGDVAAESPWRAALGGAIRVARTDKRITTTEVARRAGVSRQTLHAVERGRSEPSLSVFCNLCLAVGLEPPAVLATLPVPPHGGAS